MPHVTAIYAALGALLLLTLAARIVMQRRSSGVALGDGGERELLKRIRAHGNATEYLPMGLLLLLLLELTGVSAPWLHACGATLIGARVLHGWGLSRRSGVSFGRFVGTLLTWLVTVAMALALLIRAMPA